METFSALLAICVGNSPVTGEFPTNNREAGDLRRYRAHYGVTVMDGGGDGDVVTTKYNDVMTWKLFPRSWPLYRGIQLFAPNGF